MVEFTRRGKTHTQSSRRSKKAAGIHASRSNGNSVRRSDLFLDQGKKWPRPHPYDPSPHLDGQGNGAADGETLSMTPLKGKR